MKIKVLSRNPEEYYRETIDDINKIHRNYDKHAHPLQAAREYARALNAVKLEKIFAKPFMRGLSGHKEPVQKIACHPARISWLASAAMDGVVKIWDLKTGAAIYSRLVHDSLINGLSFTADGHALISSGVDSKINIFSISENGSDNYNNINNNNLNNINTGYFNPLINTSIVTDNNRISDHVTRGLDNNSVISGLDYNRISDNINNNYNNSKNYKLNYISDNVDQDLNNNKINNRSDFNEISDNIDIGLNNNKINDVNNNSNFNKANDNVDKVFSDNRLNYNRINNIDNRLNYNRNHAFNNSSDYNRINNNVDLGLNKNTLNNVNNRLNYNSINNNKDLNYNNINGNDLNYNRINDINTGLENNRINDHDLDNNRLNTNIDTGLDYNRFINPNNNRIYNKINDNYCYGINCNIVETIVVDYPIHSLDCFTNPSLYVAGGEGLSIYNTTRKTPVRSYELNNEIIHHIRCNKVESSIFCTLGTDRGFSVYDCRVRSKSFKVLLGMRGNCASWNPMVANSVIIGSEDSNIYLFDIRKINRAAAAFISHTNSVLDVDFNCTGEEFVSGSYDRSIRIFNTHSQFSREIYHTKRMQRVFCTRFTADSQYIACGSDEMNIRLWKTEASKPLGYFRPRQKRAINYNRKLINKYRFHPEIRRIHGFRHLPKHLFNAVAKKKAEQTARKRKIENAKVFTKKIIKPRKAVEKIED